MLILHILMQTIEQKFEDIDEKFKMTFLDTQKEEQTQVDTYLAETYEAMSMVDSYYVSIPMPWLGSDGQTYSFNGFYIDPALKIDFSVLYDALEFRSPDNESILNSVSGAAFITMDSPCKEWSDWIIPIKREKISVDALNKFTIKSKMFNGQLSGLQMKDQADRNWLCAGEK